MEDKWPNTVNTKVAEDQVMEGARTSVERELTSFSQNIPISATGGLTVYHKNPTRFTNRYVVNKKFLLIILTMPAQWVITMTS